MIWKFFKKKYDTAKTYALANPFVSALLFVVFSWLVVAWIVQGFEAHAEGKNINSVGDAVWWGIVTLLTVGYGDKFPVTVGGRIFAGLLMVSGVVGIAIVTAKISSYFLERALRERRGFVDTNLLKDHFVICGWKDEMSDFLLHVLASNPRLKDENIVLLNHASDEEIETLLALPKLKKLKVIKGDFFVEVNLRRAAPERAQKILILADATPNAAGQVPTPTEADARTIMTAMTLNSIAKGTPVAAEILDSSMDQYLRLAHVNEIIYTRDSARLLLAMASMGTGVANIYHDLLSSHSPYFLTTEVLPDSLVNQPYKSLAAHFQAKSKQSILIGLLENSGNSHIAKEKALKRAQQTPNVSKLVENLHAVKALRFNKPLFAVPEDYVVKEGSMAILIENREAVSGDAHA